MSPRSDVPTRPRGPLLHTYSIVARDPVTGEMGVAVQSHWFSVGTVVGWGRSGVGVVATQSLVNRSYGIRGLDLLGEGLGPEEALARLLEGDEGRAYRQAAILDGTGRTATHTGSRCIAEAGHLAGPGYSVQANMMRTDAVWPAMAEAFERGADRPLAERMVSVLEAAEAAGGDIRGRQSAALLVVGPEPVREPWNDRRVDLRVDDHPEPVAELKRLLRVHRAYAHMNAGDLAIEQGDVAGAMREYAAARDRFPENLEMSYWTAVALANAGQLADALPLFAEVFRQDASWRELTRRLTVPGLLQVDADALAAILGR